MIRNRSIGLLGLGMAMAALATVDDPHKHGPGTKRTTEGRFTKPKPTRHTQRREKSESLKRMLKK